MLKSILLSATSACFALLAVLVFIQTLDFWSWRRWPEATISAIITTVLSICSGILLGVSFQIR